MRVLWYQCVDNYGDNYRYKFGYIEQKWWHILHEDDHEILKSEVSNG